MLSLACWAEAEMIFKASNKTKKRFSKQFGSEKKETEKQIDREEVKHERQGRIPVVFFKSGESSGSFAT